MVLFGLFEVCLFFAVCLFLNSPFSDVQGKLTLPELFILSLSYLLATLGAESLPVRIRTQL